MAILKCNGRQIHYIARGSGPPLLLLNHSGASARGWREEFLSALDGQRFLVLPDNRGCGGSSDDDSSFGMRDLAEDMLAVVNAEGLEAFDLFGISMGGAIAQELALAAPGRVRRLV
jgi:pimeloyl-ACP methyl ester carboxylesterase